MKIIPTIFKVVGTLKKPEYIFRPKQIYYRVSYPRKHHHPKVVSLPWGLNIKVDTNEVLGRSLCTLGVYDLGVTETLWRLIDVGEHVIDVGANIGYMTSLMAAKVGRQGKVYAFEPHPKIFEELSCNEKLWRDSRGLGRVDLQNVAISNRSGFGVLEEPDHFETNRGVAFLINDISSNGHPDNSNGSRIWSVELNELDELIKDKKYIRVIKLDVEGHELEVLEGATELISTYVRDIIFEDHGIYPTPVTQLLEDYGYTILKIGKGVLRPHLQPPIFKSNLPLYEPPSYLATKDVARASGRIRKIGWKSLNSSRSA